MQNGTPAEERVGLGRRLLAMLRHEFSNMPLTFIASFIVVADLAYDTARYFLSPLPPAAKLPTPPLVISLPKIPVAGVNFVVTITVFLLLQSVIVSIYVRVQLALLRMDYSGSLIISIICALVAAWITTFVSFAFVVVILPAAWQNIIALIVASFVCVLLLMYFIDYAREHEGTGVATLLLYMIASVVLTVYFCFEIVTYFSSASH